MKYMVQLSEFIKQYPKHKDCTLNHYTIFHPTAIYYGGLFAEHVKEFYKFNRGTGE